MAITEYPIEQPLYAKRPVGTQFGAQPTEQNPEYDDGPLTFATGMLKGIPSFFLRAGESVLGVAEAVIPGDPLKGAIENVQSFRERMFPMPEGGWEWAGRVVGEAIPFLGMSVASYGATGSALGPFLTAFTVEGGTAYNEARRAGVSEWRAKTEGALVGTLNGLIEMYLLPKVFKFSEIGKGSAKEFVKKLKSGLLKEAGGEFKNITSSMIKSAFTEGIEEMVQQGVSLAVPAAVSDRFPKNPDGSTNWNTVLTEIGASGLGGAIAGGFLTGARTITGGAPEIARPTQVEIDKARTNIEGLKLPYKRKQLMLDQFDKQWSSKSVKQLEEIQVPEPQQNVFRRSDGTVVFDEKTLRERHTEDGGTEIYDPETNEVVTPAPELTRGLNETVDNYKTRIQEVSKPVITEWDTITQDLNNAVDKIVELRPEQEEAFRKERGKRFKEFRTLINEVENPILKAYVSRQALAGELPGAVFTPLSEVMSREKMEVIWAKAAAEPLLETEYLHLTEGLDKLFFKGKLPARNEIDALSLIFSTETTQKLIDARKRLGKDKFNTFLELLNIPRSILASFDVSAGGRQGLILLFRNPKLWVKAVGAGYRAFASEEYTNFMDMQIRTHPYFKKLKKSGLILTRVGGMTSGEEVFRSDLAERIPGIGKGIKASERAYVTTLNLLRANNFYKIAEQWEGKGYDQGDYDQLASYLNHATGRGDIKQLGRLMPALSALFFAPKLTIGRVQTITDLVTKPTIRKMIARDLATFVATVLGLLSLASLRRGVTVEKDPRSSDFGKIRFGNTRIDMLGGYQQLIRYTTQLMMGETKSTETGRMMQSDRGKTIWRFLQSKMSPVAMLATDIIRKETFLGTPMELNAETLATEIQERLVPLFIQDVIDAGVHQNMSTMFVITPLALHGIGAQTYPTTTSSESAKLKDTYAKEFADSRWDELGPEAQTILREIRPQITIMEDKARFERENTSFLTQMVKQQDATSKRIYSSLPKNVKSEMDRLTVRIPGLSRNINSDWYLNDKRYKDYENIVSKQLNKLLPDMMTNSIWNTISDTIRTELLNDMITNVKQSARDEIVLKATMKDLQTVNMESL